MTTKHKHRKIPFIILIVFILTFSFGVFAALADDKVVTDANLIKALLALGADSNGDEQITTDEIEALTGDIDLSGKKISDITGLEYAIGVNSINLKNNTIRDISVLTKLIAKKPALTSVDLSKNYLVVTKGSEDFLIIKALIDAEYTVIFEPQKAIPVSGISLEESLVICLNDTVTLVPTIKPADATNQTVIWTSSDESVVTVKNGVVKGIGKGKATIIATITEETNGKSFSAKCTFNVKSNTIESTKYSIDRKQGIIKNISKLTSPEQLISNLSNDAKDILIYDKDGKLNTLPNIGTGMSVNLMVADKQRDSLKTIVNGDANGDGAISISDYTLARLDILGLKPLKGVYKTACDVNSDGKISISDYTTIRLDILGLKPITVAPDLPKVSDPRIRAFLDIALAQQGKPYVWGARGPSEFDCSGYVYYCLNQAGYTVGRTTADSYSKRETWPYIPRDKLQPGDLMFYKSDTNPNVIGHIGIYLGNGYHIHASSDYGCIIICKIDGWYDRMLSFGRRVFN